MIYSNPTKKIQANGIINARMTQFDAESQHLNRKR